MAMVSIELEHVGVEIPIFNANARSLKKQVMRTGSGGLISRNANKLITIQALRDINLHFGHGDRVALIGHNGAGKTTLLKVLAGIYEPTEGVVRRRGRTSTLFDITLGMDMEATGYENIYFQGLFMGLTRHTVRKKTDEISEFTGLGDYLAMPVRTYSSGMMLRLAFSVFTCVEPEILIMDEWISVGDLHFMEKAQKRMEEVVERSGLLVLASHSNELIRQICNKAVLLEQGAIKAYGAVDEIINIYVGSAAHE